MPSELAGKIAAGEVVRRPASVVKELLENALDAGAGRISVAVTRAGRGMIQVHDDGSGMNEKDLPLCFEQHATSKIEQAEDLGRIRTMGFRGEAMASIASVSRVEVLTRPHDRQEGMIYRVEGGEEVNLEPAPAEPGTSVTVRQLFYNVPARRQFLKTDATEFRHILRTFQTVALAHPDLELELEADGETVYRLPPADREKRVADLFGSSYRASLIPFEESTSYLKIRGLLSDPKLAKKSRGEQFLYVNRRPVQHRYLTHLILSIYEKVIGERQFPFYALFLEIDPEHVDVNVHPAKEEVKFDDEKSVVQLTRSVVRKALHQYLLVPGLPDEDRESVADRPISFRGLSEFLSPESADNRRRSGESGEMQIPSRINFDRQETNRRTPETDSESRVPSVKGENDPSHERIPAQEFWQLHNRYILSQTRSGLCLVDQHRAHMRVIYEKTLSATEEALPGTQQLLFAQSIECSASDYELLKELLPILRRMGFSIELLSGKSVLLSGVPADIDVGNEQSVLQEMLQGYRELDGKPELDARKRIAAAFASRTAIPRGWSLKNAEMERVIDQLFACEEPYRDPFGRATLHYLSLEEIANRLR